jgi:phytoene dehydrogenase-like protein
VEASSVPGGKVHTREIDGAKIDSGPTVFTMRWVFDELFQEVGTSLSQELTLTPLSVLARHFWPDGSMLDLSANAQESEADIEKWSSPSEALLFRQFCKTAQENLPQLGRAGHSIGSAQYGVAHDAFRPDGFGPIGTAWTHAKLVATNVSAIQR